MAKEAVAGAGVVGTGLWLWRGSALVGILGTGATAAYYKGKAEGVSKEADSAAVQLAEQKAALAQEQARLADIQRESAEVARQRAEMHSIDMNTELLVAALVVAALGAMWYALHQRAQARKHREEAQAVRY